MTIGRKTGGRQMGTPNKANAFRAAAIAASGLTPLDYLIAVMRDETKPTGERIDAAKSAAPFVHSRLGPVTPAGDPAGPIVNLVISDA